MCMIIWKTRPSGFIQKWSHIQRTEQMGIQITCKSNSKAVLTKTPFPSYSLAPCHSGACYCPPTEGPCPSPFLAHLMFSNPSFSFLPALLWALPTGEILASGASSYSHCWHHENRPFTLSFFSKCCLPRTQILLYPAQRERQELSSGKNWNLMDLAGRRAGDVGSNQGFIRIKKFCIFSGQWRKDNFIFVWINFIKLRSHKSLASVSL